MNCSNCQNPIAEGEKFCRKCGSPANVSPSPGIQPSYGQESGSKKTVFVIVGAIVLFAVVAAAAFWFFAGDKEESAEADSKVISQNVPAVPSDIASKPAVDVTKISPNVPQAESSGIKNVSFEFLGTKFVFGWQGGDEKIGQVMYEFFPEGETEKNWTKIVTVVHNVGKQMAQEEADVLFKATMDGMVSKGAVVSSQSKNNNVNVAIFSFSAGNNAEINIKKAFVFKGELVSVTYGIRVSGSGEADLKRIVGDQSGKMKGLQNQFVDFKVPFPWEITGK